MSYSSLKRKTPLRSRHGFKKPSSGRQSAGSEKGGERAKAGAGRTRKNDRSSLETHLDIVFSLYVRLRDAMDGGRCRCISCGRIFPFAQIQCGHYHSRHNRSVRWDGRNCNAECFSCNCNDPDHLAGYKDHLVAKIGKQQFDELNVVAHQSRKWSGDELRQMLRYYTAEVRRLSKDKGIRVNI